MSAQLALTTNQIKFGVLIATGKGPQFLTLRTALIITAAWLLALALRVVLAAAAAMGYLQRLALANLAHHTAIFVLGLRVVIGLEGMEPAL